LEFILKKGKKIYAQKTKAESSIITPRATLLEATLFEFGG
jgi:hypothetical protein